MNVRYVHEFFTFFQKIDCNFAIYYVIMIHKV